MNIKTKYRILKQIISEVLDEVEPEDRSKYYHLVERRIAKMKPQPKTIGFDEIIELFEDVRKERIEQDRGLSPLPDTPETNL